MTKRRERVCDACGREYRDKREHEKTCPLSNRATRRQFDADWAALRSRVAPPSVLDDPAVQQADRERWDRAKAAEERRAS